MVNIYACCSLEIGLNMIIIIKDTDFENNPSHLNEDAAWKGTVHTGSGIMENVYGVSKDHVIELAKCLKNINRDFSFVLVYQPITNKRREYVELINI